MDKYNETGFPGGSAVKNLPTMQETQEMQEMWVRSLGGKDVLEKGMATHSSILDRIFLIFLIEYPIFLIEEPGWLQSMGSQEVGHD